VRGFGFRLGAYDPFVPDEAFEAAGVTKMGLDEAIREADILALHLPLTTETRHVLNRERLAAMKYGAIVVNTARGALVDTVALAEALVSGHVGGAGLDVFEAEPLEEGHPLRRSPNTILTSHVAWYSEASVPRLQVMAAEEVVRGLKGERLRNRVNG
jgi:D-3-phosphoglycerate dehydrogenase